MRGSPAAPAASQTAEARQPTHTILVDSTPQGATVKDGDKVLGTTPLAIDLDPAAPPRKFVMSLDGYAQHTFLPTRDDSRIMVPLAPIQKDVAATPPPTAAPTAAPADRPAKSVVRTPAVPATTKPAVPSDINMAR
jgi:hypothetical protein